MTPAMATHHDLRVLTLRMDALMTEIQKHNLMCSKGEESYFDEEDLLSRRSDLLKEYYRISSGVGNVLPLVQKLSEPALACGKYSFLEGFGLFPHAELTSI